MNRREFIGAATVAFAFHSFAKPAKAVRLPTRVLGRTGLRVPILGFGSGSRFLMYKEEDKALEALTRAIDLGITYIDTAHGYGNGRSEEWIGKLMSTRRKEVTLATKIAARTADAARREIEISLKGLQTDHVEVMHIHALANEQDLAAIEAKGGVLEAMYEARDKKITRAIGITSHAAPSALRAALERHDFDCTQMALNAGLASMADVPTGFKLSPAGESSFEKLALPVAVRKKMGVIAMKVFGQEQLLGAAPVEKLLQYALSLPITLASVGMPRLEHIGANAAMALSFTPMSSKQRRRLEESIDSGRKLAMHSFFASHEDA